MTQGLRQRFRSRLMAVVRVAALFLTVQMLALVWLIGRARAHSAETLHNLGAHVAALAGKHDAAVHSLFVNGVEFKTRSSHTQDGVGDVLAALRRTCARRGGLAGYGGLELSDESEGIAVCFDSGMPYSPVGLRRALERFVTTGDLMSIGNLRYVRVRRAERGGTVSLLAWTEGPIKLLEMFPPSGDAPGRDVPGVPRPPRARRLLSSWETTRQSSVTVYVSPVDPGEARRFYEQSLERLGFRLVQRKGSGPLLVTRDERQLLLTFDEDHLGRTLVSIAVL